MEEKLEPRLLIEILKEMKDVKRKLEKIESFIGMKELSYLKKIWEQ
jgi:hypothetical protein